MQIEYPQEQEDFFDPSASGEYPNPVIDWSDDSILDYENNPERLKAKLAEVTEQLEKERAERIELEMKMARNKNDWGNGYLEISDFSYFLQIVKENSDKDAVVYELNEYIGDEYYSLSAISKLLGGISVGRLRNIVVNLWGAGKGNKYFYTGQLNTVIRASDAESGGVIWRFVLKYSRKAEYISSVGVIALLAEIAKRNCAVKDTRAIIPLRFNGKEAENKKNNKRYLYIFGRRAYNKRVQTKQ